MAKRQRFQPLRVVLPKPTGLPSIRLFAQRPRGPNALKQLTKAPELWGYGEPPPMPASFVGTTPEYRVVWWLEKHDIVYDFQSSLLGGRQQLGGIVADVILPEMVPPMVLQVMGVFWHYSTGEQRLKDQRQRDQLSNLGYQIVAIDEDDILERLDWVMQRAVRGEDVSRAVWSR